jgi:hypothetical protein
LRAKKTLVGRLRKGCEEAVGLNKRCRFSIEQKEFQPVAAQRPIISLSGLERDQKQNSETLGWMSLVHRFRAMPESREEIARATMFGAPLHVSLFKQAAKF